MLSCGNSKKHSTSHSLCCFLKPQTLKNQSILAMLGGGWRKDAQKAVLGFYKTYKTRILQHGVLMLIGVLMSGCMSLSDVTGPFKMLSSKPPAKPEKVAQNTLPPPLYVAGTTGMPPGWSKRLHMHIENESRKKSIPISKTAGNAANVELVGHLSAAEVRSGTLVAYVWDVQNKKGDKLHRITGQRDLGKRGARGPWSAINDETLRQIGEEAAGKIRGWMTEKGYQMQPVQLAQNTPPETQAKPVREPLSVAEAMIEQKPLATPRLKSEVKKAPAVKKNKTASVESSPLPAPQKHASKPSRKPAETARKKPAPQKQVLQKTTPAAQQASFVYLSGVKGATGNGNSELTRAIISSLARNGLGISPSPQPAGYKLEGSVKIEPAENGEDKVHLSWQVRTADGTLIGTVSQKNSVKAGSFNQSWGQTAFLAADAAAGSIKMVIDKREKQKI